MTNSYKHAAIAILLNEKNEFLMQLRDNKRGIAYSGYWGFFGGGIEINETPRKAIERELNEEIPNCEIRGLRLLETVISQKKDHVTIFQGYVTQPLKEITFSEGRKIDYIKYKDLLKLKMPVFLKEYIIKNEILK